MCFTENSWELLRTKNSQYLANHWEFLLFHQVWQIFGCSLYEICKGNIQEAPGTSGNRRNGRNSHWLWTWHYVLLTLRNACETVCKPYKILPNFAMIRQFFNFKNSANYQESPKNHCKHWESLRILRTLIAHCTNVFGHARILIAYERFAMRVNTNIRAVGTGLYIWAEIHLEYLN